MRLEVAAVERFLRGDVRRLRSPGWGAAISAPGGGGGPNRGVAFLLLRLQCDGDAGCSHFAKRGPLRRDIRQPMYATNAVQSMSVLLFGTFAARVGCAENVARALRASRRFAHHNRAVHRERPPSRLVCHCLLRVACRNIWVSTPRCPGAVRHRCASATDADASPRPSAAVVAGSSSARDAKQRKLLSTCFSFCTACGDTRLTVLSR